MYNTVPGAATGIILAGATAIWLGPIFLICAAFAIFGAILAIKRIIPISNSVKKSRDNKRTLKLQN